MTKRPYTITDIWHMLGAYVQPPQQNMYLIDRACVGGDVAAQASASGYHVLAQESSHKLQILAQKRWSNIGIDWQSPTAIHSQPAQIIWAGAGLINQHYPNIQNWLNEQYEQLIEGGQLIIDSIMEAECYTWSQQANLVTQCEDFVCYQLREYGTSGYTAEQERVWFYRTPQGWQRERDTQTIQAANQQELEHIIQASPFTLETQLTTAGQPLALENEPRIIWILRR